MWPDFNCGDITWIWPQVSESSGSLARSACRGTFWGKTGILNQRKSPKQWCGVAHIEPESLILAFISWTWMTSITWPRNLFSLNRCDPWGTPQIFFLFLSVQIPPYLLNFKEKKKTASFPNFCFWRRLIAVFCIHPKEGEEAEVSLKEKIK